MSLKASFLEVRRALHYVSGTINMGVKFECVETFHLQGYGDSDQGGSMDDRRSTTSQIFNLGSGAVAWASKRQDVIALSSMNAEYITTTSAACQALWMCRLLGNTGVVQHGGTTIYCDNQSAIAIGRNPAQHGRTKHIDVHFHFIHSFVPDGVINVVHCSTHDQLAGILMKALSRPKHEELRRWLGIVIF